MLRCLVNFLTLLSLVISTCIRFEWFIDLSSTSFDLGFLFLLLHVFLLFIPNALKEELTLDAIWARFEEFS